MCIRDRPSVYVEDDLTRRLCTAVDQVLAPVGLTLDSLPAYLDPDTAPEDLLDWLSSWVALPPRGSLTPVVQRVGGPDQPALLDGVQAAPRRERDPRAEPVEQRRLVRSAYA